MYSSLFQSYLLLPTFLQTFTQSSKLPLRQNHLYLAHSSLPQEFDSFFIFFFFFWFWNRFAIHNWFVLLIVCVANIHFSFYCSKKYIPIVSLMNLLLYILLMRAVLAYHVYTTIIQSFPCLTHHKKKIKLMYYYQTQRGCLDNPICFLLFFNKNNI